jgi:hypothetical protein
MLEYPNLLIRPNDTGWDIVEPDTGRLLGVARRRSVRPTWRLRWLERATVDVLEAEDEPLVFTVRRLWGFVPRWEICDADGHRVALVQRGRILDAFGTPWATIKTSPAGIRFCTGERQFARAGKSSAGLDLCFASDLQDQPLTKMSVLGAVLALNDG